MYISKHIQERLLKMSHSRKFKIVAALLALAVALSVCAAGGKKDDIERRGNNAAGSGRRHKSPYRTFGSQRIGTG